MVVTIAKQPDSSISIAVAVAYQRIDDGQVPVRLTVPDLRSERSGDIKRLGVTGTQPCRPVSNVVLDLFVGRGEVASVKSPQQCLNIGSRPGGNDRTDSKNSRKFLFCDCRVRTASDWVGDRRQALGQVVKAFVDPGAPGLQHPGGCAWVSANRFDVPRHQDGHHSIDGSGGEVLGFMGMVRVGTGEAISWCGLILRRDHDPPRRDGLQVLCNRLLAEPFLKSGLSQKVGSDVLLAESIQQALPPSSADAAAAKPVQRLVQQIVHDRGRLRRRSLTSPTFCQQAGGVRENAGDERSKQGGQGRQGQFRHLSALFGRPSRLRSLVARIPARLRKTRAPVGCLVRAYGAGDARKRGEPLRNAHTGDVQSKVVRWADHRLQWCAGARASPWIVRACTVRVVVRVGTEVIPHVCRDTRDWFNTMYFQARFSPLPDRTARRLVYL